MAKKALDFLAGTDIVKAGASGAFLQEVSSDGELLSEIYVPPGTHKAARFMFEIGRGSYLVPGSDAVCYTPPVKTRAIDFGEMHDETAASQTWRVDPAEREKKEREKLTRRLDRFERMQRLQERALARSRGEPDAEPEPELEADPEGEATVPAVKPKPKADAAAL